MGGQMTFFVPYDGTALARAALEQAADLADGVDASVVVATIIPRNRDYATERDWVQPNEAFDLATVRETLRGQVLEIEPRAEFRSQAVDAHVRSGTIATRLRDMALDIGADVVFLGSENVGSVAAPVSSIGQNVATRLPYDIYLVQSTE